MREIGEHAINKWESSSNEPDGCLKIKQDHFFLLTLEHLASMVPSCM